jgi:hypothetical protein
VDQKKKNKRGFLMENNLKLCPFCGQKPYGILNILDGSYSAAICINYKCPLSQISIDFDVWQSRPCEDTLQSTIETQGIEIRRLWLVERILRSNLDIVTNALRNLLKSFRKFQDGGIYIELSEDFTQYNIKKAYTALSEIEKINI